MKDCRPEKSDEVEQLENRARDQLIEIRIRGRTWTEACVGEKRERSGLRIGGRGLK